MLPEMLPLPLPPCPAAAELHSLTRPKAHERCLEYSVRLRLATLAKNCCSCIMMDLHSTGAPLKPEPQIFLNHHEALYSAPPATLGARRQDIRRPNSKPSYRHTPFLNPEARLVLSLRTCEQRWGRAVQVFRLRDPVGL